MTETGCSWATGDAMYQAYHDVEWGLPDRNSMTLWEKLTLESFQSGLSWRVILAKRDGFRRAFAGFDPSVVASWGDADIDRLVQDEGIVRHRGKITATLGNARAMLEIDAAQGFAAYLWGFVDGTPIQNNWDSVSQVPSQTPISQALSKDLKSLGFRFCGPTTVYAFMQAAGLVNDHVTSCPRHSAVQALEN